MSESQFSFNEISDFPERSGLEPELGFQANGSDGRSGYEIGRAHV